MEFLFRPQDALDRSQLFQGDLLARTPVLQAALGNAHSYYADAEDYTHFMILTQSCDLVRRGKRPAKSRYVTLAACRPLAVMLDRSKASQSEKVQGFPIAVLSAERKVRAAQLLERLLHNTEDGYFFIRKESVAGVPEDLCAFLPLSVAVRAEEHYEACTAAKIGELHDIYAAKLGWMVGNLYSRVGTPDLEEKLPDPDQYKREFFNEFLADESLWMTSLQIRWIGEQTRSWQRDHKGQVMSEEEAQNIIESVPAPELILADTIIAALTRGKALSADNVDRARNLLSSNNLIKQVARQVAS
ncbi:MAG: hypothetical protein ABIY37_01465 [Devosia sp.]